MNPHEVQTDFVKIGQLGEVQFTVMGRYDKRRLPFGMIRTFAIGKPGSWVIGEGFVSSAVFNNEQYTVTVHFSGDRTFKKRLTPSDVVIRCCEVNT